MTWALIDDEMAFHAKTVAAGNAAFGAWVRMLCWTRRAKTDGRLPAGIVRSIASKVELATLIRVRLLDAAGEDFAIHDFRDHNLSAAALAERREKTAPGRREKAQKAAKARWNKAQTMPGTDQAPSPPEHPADASHDAPEMLQTDAPEHCISETEHMLGDAPDMLQEDAQKCPAIRHPDLPSEKEVLLLPTEGAKRASPPPPPPELGKNPTVHAVRRALSESSTLAGLATMEFAQRLAAFSDEDGFTGSKGTADVIQAIRDADRKVADEESVGEHMGRGKQVALVIGFVKRQERARRTQAPAAASPRPSPAKLAEVQARVAADSDRLLAEAAEGKGLRW